MQQLSVGGNSVGEVVQALRESRDGNQRLADQLGEVRCVGVALCVGEL